MRVNSSTIPRDGSSLSNILGVIQGSKRSHPPIFNPRTLSLPKLNATDRFASGSLVTMISK